MTSIKQHQQKNADAREADRAEMITFHCLLARERKYWGGGAVHYLHHQRPVDTSNNAPSHTSYKTITRK